MNKSIITRIYKKDSQKIVFSTKEGAYIEGQLGMLKAFGKGSFLFLRQKDGLFLIIWNSSGASDVRSLESATEKDKQFVLNKAQKTGE